MTFPVFRWVLWVLLKPLIKDVRGVENAPLKGAFIIVANHESYLDPFIILYSLIKRTNKKIHFIAMTGRTKFLWKIGIFNRFFREWAGIVPLDDGKRKALKNIENLLRGGNIAGLFPGGPRALDGRLTSGKTGAVRLALAAKVPILPIGIKGSIEVAAGDRLMPKFKRVIAVKVGKPIYFKKFYSKKLSKKILVELTNKVMKEISGLSGKKYLYA